MYTPLSLQHACADFNVCCWMQVFCLYGCGFRSCQGAALLKGMQGPSFWVFDFTSSLNLNCSDSHTSLLETKKSDSDTRVTVLLNLHIPLKKKKLSVMLWLSFPLFVCSTFNGVMWSWQFQWSLMPVRALAGLRSGDLTWANTTTFTFKCADLHRREGLTAIKLSVTLTWANLICSDLNLD